MILRWNCQNKKPRLSAASNTPALIIIAWNRAAKRACYRPAHHWRGGCTTPKHRLSKMATRNTNTTNICSSKNFPWCRGDRIDECIERNGWTRTKNTFEKGESKQYQYTHTHTPIPAIACRQAIAGGMRYPPFTNCAPKTKIRIKKSTGVY